MTKKIDDKKDTDIEDMIKVSKIRKSIEKRKEIRLADLIDVFSKSFTEEEKKRIIIYVGKEDDVGCDED
jgi:hypothetical protein